jgi:phosphoheptose isomerase
VNSSSYNVVESAHLTAGLSLSQALKGNGQTASKIVAEVRNEVSSFLESVTGINDIMTFAKMAMSTAQAGRKIVFIGEGSSISSASHSATDFSKSGLTSVAISDSNLITAMMNDFGRDSWLVKGLERHSSEGDLVVLLIHDQITPAETHAIQWCHSSARQVVAIGGSILKTQIYDQLHHYVPWNSTSLVSNHVMPSIANLAVADGLLTLMSK